MNQNEHKTLGIWSSLLLGILTALTAVVPNQIEQQQTCLKNKAIIHQKPEDIGVDESYVKQLRKHKETCAKNRKKRKKRKR